MALPRSRQAPVAGREDAPGLAAEPMAIKRSPLRSSDQQLLTDLLRRNEDLLIAQSLLTDRVNALWTALRSAHRFAYHDELTGLPNRRLLVDRFEQATALATRRQGLLAMLYLDLNDFKDVNDRLGHRAGDDLLIQFAERLSSVIRSSDSACRIGGDEFVVLLTEVRSRGGAAKKLEDIRAKLRPQYFIRGHSIRLRASIGLAIWPSDARAFSELLSSADRAMFVDKGLTRALNNAAQESKVRPRQS